VLQKVGGQRIDEGGVERIVRRGFDRWALADGPGLPLRVDPVFSGGILAIASSVERTYGKR
jgi:hypothetical protein